MNSSAITNAKWTWKLRQSSLKTTTQAPRIPTTRSCSTSIWSTESSKTGSPFGGSSVKGECFSVLLKNTFCASKFCVFIAHRENFEQVSFLFFDAFLKKYYIFNKKLSLLYQVNVKFQIWYRVTKFVSML